MFTYWPATHAVHADVPVVSELYVPTVHDVHTVDVVATVTLLYVPAPHAAHAEAPEVPALYVPAAHAVHTAA